MTVTVAHPFDKEFVSGLFADRELEVVFLREGELAIYQNADGMQAVADLQVLQVTIPKAESDQAGQYLQTKIGENCKPEDNTVYILSCDHAEVAGSFLFCQLVCGFAHCTLPKEDETETV